ncbi:MAG: hypothetical protein AAFU64_10680, partial [Bacteroidota bacterium]
KINLFILKKAAFKIYQYDFYCDKCGAQTCMGIIAYSQKYHKICDLCLVNDQDPSEKPSEGKTKDRERNA